MAQKNDRKMVRGLKNRHIQLIALGGTIGTGLFLGSGESISLTGPSILLAYTITGVICFLIMRALGTLLLSDLEANSFIEPIAHFLGTTTGFVAGWTYWMCWIIGAIAEVTAAGIYINFWFPNIPSWLTGLVILCLIYALNTINVAAYGENEFWFALIKVLAIIAIIAIGVVLVLINYKTPTGHASVSNLYSHKFFGHGWQGFALSFQMVVFSLTGVEMIGMTAGETKDPVHVIPKAIDAVPFRIILFYIGALAAIMCVIPWQSISPDASPFVAVFKNIGITGAAGIVNFVVLTAATSACNSSIYTTGRMLFSLTNGSNNKFANKLGTLSKRRIPQNAITFSILVVGIATLLNVIIPKGVFVFIASISTTLFLFMWSLIILAQMKYRKQVDKAGKADKLIFKMPLYPFSSYLVLAFLIFVAIVLLFKTSSLIALIGSLIWIGALYLIKIRKNKRKDALK
ncbi:amino acid permease [Fructilactobacillus lindneri]|uniref:Transporter ydgF n=2 Tax=Fructilactobacillus lindneri TaxID=53444 RepID=A0A0R2JMQ5_9LACO|nr:amino acid permease [Fructilactobacillus lindneri]ANZ57682.1 D-alanine/D-serine/glycine permease [Fructilactobacillus lindneri]ANZ58952.1 D-alanine/D-serine/glycine permease [Fructilactobacillus lindneri]KRN78418.1 transporter ydgF [Fructilactobacillus lindneri DSM 20690 = JCM 11027]POG97977.1 amino acid permease [Fructilactobacillus lindneri]POG99031.1 amino acid permease [Fructilactobacillus lindneri]